MLERFSSVLCKNYNLRRWDLNIKYNCSYVLIKCMDLKENKNSFMFEFKNLFAEQVIF